MPCSTILADHTESSRLSEQAFGWRVRQFAIDSSPYSGPTNLSHSRRWRPDLSVAELPTRRNISRQDTHDFDLCGREVRSRNGFGRLMIVVKTDHEPKIDHHPPAVPIYLYAQHPTATCRSYRIHSKDVPDSATTCAWLARFP